MKAIRWFMTLAIPAIVSAQSPATDSAVARARQRASTGDSAAARMILDSLLASQTSTPTDAPESLYWHARFAASSADRERDLTTLVVEYPFSPRSNAAFFELGMLELARGDRERAATNLSRFLANSPADSNRTTASLALGRLLLDLGDQARGCAVILTGRAELPSGAVEIRNQFDFSAGACRGVDTSSTPPAPTPTPSDSATDPQIPVGEYSVQVAAYDLKSQADRLATRLRGQGLEARAIGKSKPFRVRVGHYMTHAQADSAARKIGTLTKSKPFVVLIGPEEK